MKLEKIRNKPFINLSIWLHYLNLQVFFGQCKVIQTSFGVWHSLDPMLLIPDSWYD